jgi:hypothetical protein
MNTKILASLIIFFQCTFILYGVIYEESAVAGEQDKLGGLGFPDRTVFFPEIPCWKKTHTIDAYDRRNLYDHIDGAAVLFFTYDFQELQVMEYQRDDSASVVVEVYRFQTPLHAFGMYSQERPLKGKYINIGVQAYLEAPIMNFVVGNHYIKINSFGLGNDADSILHAFALTIAVKIVGTTALPAALAYFPLNGKKPNSEKFFAKDLLGYEFLLSGYTADYVDDNHEFQLFLIEGAQTDDCLEMLKRYLQLAKSEHKILKEGQYDIKDPNYGEISLSWKGKTICGVFDLLDRDKRMKYIIQMENLIK